MVSGTGSRTSESDEENKNFEPILERFAPYTKLFMEMEWDFRSDKNGLDAYHDWISWIKENHQKTYQKIQQPIDILIATDALSEGQNLQDADMVINYDIHWNPVRIIQRLGRIDRLGSPNTKIFGINFWPSNNINSYLNLQGRIEQRMAAMKLAGAEVDEKFSETFQEMIHDESLDQKMKNRMMEQMQVTFDDLDGNESFGFDDLSLERYRQDLLEEFNKDKAKYLKMPKGVYTGFKADKSVCSEDGIIALLGYPAKPTKTLHHEYQVFDLIYINKKGEMVLLNQKEVLDALTHHKNEDRFVIDAIDKGEESTIQQLVDSIKAWMDGQAADDQVQEDGTTKRVMGTEAKDLLSKLRRGDKNALTRVKQNIKVIEKFQLDKFDLITWFIVS
jgi:superfamily II DNA/RNA helicase